MNEILESKTVFTFWEPSESMPGYLQLCIESWRKFLPNYKIVVLDYSNLEFYIGKNFYDKVLFQKFPLAQQVDAIRCAVLKKYGGIWLDADTIITSQNIKSLLNIKSDFVLIGHHIAFIRAERNAYILKNWEKEIKQRLFLYKYLKLFAKRFFKKFYNKLVNWDYLGNGIIDKYLICSDNNIFYEINRIKIKALPEVNYYMEHGENNLLPEECYRKFYFENNVANYALKDNHGIILLHNSWTPDCCRKLSKEEFLALDNTLANVLKKVLKV